MREKPFLKLGIVIHFLFLTPLLSQEQPRFEELTPPSSVTPTTPKTSPRPATSPGKLLPEIQLEPIPTLPKGPGTPIVTPPSVQGTPPSEIGVPSALPVPTQGISVDQEFQKEIERLNKEIEELKKKIIDMKGRLLAYSERVGQGFAIGTQLFIQVDSELSDDFRFEEIVVYLDGNAIFRQKFDLEKQPKRFPVFHGVVLPGRHRIDIVTILRGDEGFFDTSFSARMELTSTEYLFAQEGKIVEVKVRPYDKGGGWFTKVEERPALLLEITERDVF